MKAKQRINYISDYLDKMFPQANIALIHDNAYTLLVAVVLSAQCTDKRVNEVTSRLFQQASTPSAMVRLGVSAIESIIYSCGLSSKKSRAIVNLSEILIDKYASKVPSELDMLKELPGVGHKTASVMQAHCFGIPAFPVDTHVHRLAQMWELSNGKNVRQTEKDLKLHFPKHEWYRLHLRFILYGRNFCKARGCNGLRCQICKISFPNRLIPFKARKA